jgi:trehalose transport system permease protein
MRSPGAFVKKYKLEILLVAPLLLYMVVFTYGPVLQLAAMSLDANGDARGFVPGLDHYREVLGHYQFPRALFNTLFVTFTGLFLELTLGLFVAVQLNRHIRFRGAFRAFYLLPLGVPTIVAAANMRWIFDTNGFINKVLMHLEVIDIPINWGAGGFLTLFTIVVSDMWKVTPMVMLILLAGLESIPDEIYEAAKMDGAYAFQTFRRITLPLLKPSITMALVIRGIDSFRILELPLVLAGKSEPVLSTFAYFEYHEALNPYTSAADSVILLLLILVSIAGYLWLSGSEETVRA